MRQEANHIPTRVDERKLEEWKARMPKRLHTFMDNFFGTCQAYSPVANYFNYIHDISQYSATCHAYRDNYRELLLAFHDITGTGGGSEE